MTKLVKVTQWVEVEVDESKFTPEFLQEFRDSFYDFYDLDDHIEHLGQLCARGLDRDFIEGYGPQEEFGIKLNTLDHETITEIYGPIAPDYKDELES